ncbi:MAG: hypothetical protein OYH77_04390 [Pseudomonadota bacterium]|nr:hypothetical protein [Pseudomonadota bacterium]
MCLASGLGGGAGGYFPLQQTVLLCSYVYQRSYVLAGSYVLTGGITVQTIFKTGVDGAH